MLANLRTAIAARGYRQWEVAAELRLPASALSEIVHGRRDADASLRSRLALLLGAEEAWLFSPRVAIPPVRDEPMDQPALAATG